MIETGEVVTSDKKFAQVKIKRKAECTKCGMCGFNKTDAYLIITADNNIGAKTGDTVELNVEKDHKFLAIILALFIPLILVIGAVLIGNLIIKKEYWSGILSLIFIDCWYTILAVVDKAFSKNKAFCPKITAIKEDKGEDYGRN